MKIFGKVFEVAFDQTIAKNGGGSYKGTRITYRDTADNSLKEKNIHANALKFNPTLKNMLSELKAGDDFTMVMEKEGDFWNVKEILKGTQDDVPKPQGNSNGKASTNGNAAPRNTYETPEERAQRQVYIIRQSSISSAIAFSATLKTPLPLKEVLKVAEELASFVFQTEFDDGSIESLPSDNID